MFVPDIEAAVENYYRNVQIPEHVVTALRELITAELDRLHATARQERHAYTAERDALSAPGHGIWASNRKCRRFEQRPCGGA